MEGGKGTTVILSKVAFRLTSVKARRHCSPFTYLAGIYPLLPNSFPEPKYSILDPNTNYLLILINYLYALEGIPLSLLIDLLYIPLKSPHGLILLLHCAFVPYLGQLLNLLDQLLIDVHVFVHVTTHYLVFQEVHLSILEGE